MKLLVFLVAFISQISTDNRLKIEVLGEILCPDTIRFLMRSFKKALYTKDIELIADIQLLSFGKGKVSYPRGEIQFKCHHGENECLGNQLATCAVEQKDGLKFAVCLHEYGFDDIWSAKSKNFSESVPICAAKTGIDQNLLDSCMKNDITQLFLKVATYTLAQNVLQKTVPYILVDGEYQDTYHFAILANMLEFICQYQQTGISIEACEHYKHNHSQYQTKEYNIRLNRRKRIMHKLLEPEIEPVLKIEGEVEDGFKKEIQGLEKENKFLKQLLQDTEKKMHEQKEELNEKLNENLNKQVILNENLGTQDNLNDFKDIKIHTQIEIDGKTYSINTSME